MRRISAIPVLLFVASAGAWAQQTSETIPKELVQALLRSGMPSNDPFDLKVGPAPADFPKDVLPQGTVVALTATTERMTTVVGTAAGLVATGRADFMSALQAAGWSLQSLPQRGFVSTTSLDSTSVCKGTNFVNVALIPRTEGGHYVRASLTRDPRRQCATRPPMGDSYFADLNLPAMAPPAGAKSYGGGGGGSTDAWTANSKITVDMKLPAIAAHYRKQLVDAGWKVDGSPVERDGYSITVFRVPSKLGGAVAGLLTVIAIEGSPQIDLFLRVTRASDSRGFGGSTSTGL